MGNHWTTDQQRVIDAKNCNLLVSAAAGSGKTAVLVERILTHITDPVRPTDIDRILVVTFTKAAAGEMRERIRASLEKELQEHPSDRNLLRQSVLVHHARIMTIHSFCLDVIRNHFNVIGLDPVFRVGEEGELLLLRQDAAAQILEEAYEEGDPAFLDFAESFATGRTDDGLEKLITGFYEYSMGFPDPSHWRESCLQSWQANNAQELSSLPWIRDMCSYAHRVLEEQAGALRRALEICSQPDGPYMFIPMFQNDLLILEDLLHADTYEALADRFASGISWMRRPGKNDPAVSDRKRTEMIELRDTVKAETASLGSDCFPMSAAALLDLMHMGEKKMRVLVRLAGRFEERFSQAKRDRGIVDFHDLEHFALQILVRFENGEAVPTATAEEYGAFFEEIMIDEYQDSNMAQEVLLRSISGEALGKFPNRFMVGDVKQSIYRFRLARPEIFLEKQETYSREDDAPYRRIDLKSNFRSRPQVLDVVNHVFYGIMGKEIGHVDYDADAALYAGAVFPGEEADPEGGRADPYEPELLLICPGEESREDPPLDIPDTGGYDENGDEEENPGRVSLEAAAAADRILELMRTQKVYDSKTGQLRELRFGDIAVLLRTVSGWSDLFAETFTDKGIPVYMESGSGYFSSMEIRIMLCALALLDNPRQDIPLAGVLHSVIGGMDDRELARIRSDVPEGSFYNACAVRSTWNDPLGKRLQDFFDILNRIRDAVSYTPIHELIWMIADETGFGCWVHSLPAGESRYANLRMLAQRAADFENGNSHGLFRFLRYIEQLRKQEIDYPEAAPDSDTRDAVRIMSIHKSKGLEFPVVILSGLGKTYNRNAEREPVIFHPSMGAGFDIVDPVKRVRYAMPLRKAIALQLREEDLGEELRVLYVAMTRAKEKLIMTGSIADPGKSRNRWESASFDSSGRLSYQWRMKSRSWLDLIVPVLQNGPSGIPSGTKQRTCTVRLVSLQGTGKNRNDALSGQDVRQAFDSLNMDHCYDEKICSAFQEWKKEPASRPDVNHIRPVMSVSELKHAWMELVEEDGSYAYHTQPETASSIRTSVSAGEDSQTGSEGAARGTMYHRVMELIDFSAAPEGDACEDFVQMQLETMLKCGKIQKDVQETVSVSRIAAFLNSEIGKRMVQAHRQGRLHREMPFVLGVPARQIRREWMADDIVMIQGIIDAWFEEPEGIVLLDYKTDSLPSGGMDILCRRYQMQMHYYKKALEQLIAKPVKQALLYSFSLGESADVADSVLPVL